MSQNWLDDFLFINYSDDWDNCCGAISFTFHLDQSPISFYETSTLTGENMDLVFEALAKMVIKRHV